MYFWIYGLDIHCGGWHPPENWNPPLKPDAPARDSDKWESYRRYQFGFQTLSRLIERPPNCQELCPLAAGIIEAYNAPTLVSVDAGVTLGGMHGELCPTLVVNLHRTVIRGGPSLVLRTDAEVMERLGHWLVRNLGCDWVTLRHLAKKLSIDVTRATS